MAPRARDTSVLPVSLLCFTLAACAFEREAEEPVWGLIQWHDELTASQDFEVDLLTAWNGVVRAVRDLGYSVGPDEARVTPDAQLHLPDVDISLEENDADFTRVRVRGHGGVGRAQVRAILEEVQNRLAARYHGRRGGDR